MRFKTRALGGVLSRIRRGLAGLAGALLASQAAGADTLRVVGDGRLEIDGAPGSFYQLQSIRTLAEPRVWENSGSVQMTAIPGPIGWTFTPSESSRFFRVEIRAAMIDPAQAQAEQRVVTEVIRPGEQQSLVLGLRWPEPVPAGAVLEPLSNSEENPKLWTVEADSWLFVIDHAPAQKLGHPFTYVLAPKAGGALRVLRSFSPPVVNGAIHLATIGERWQPAARFFPADLATAAPLAKSLTLEYLPLPAEEGEAAGLAEGELHALADAGSTSTGRLTVDCTQTPGKKIAVVIASGADDEIQNDAREMSALLTRLGFTVTDTNSKSNSVSQVIAALQTASQGIGPCDKFFVYLSSHTQLVDDNDDGKPDSTPTRLDYGSGHKGTATKWGWLPGRTGTLATVLQAIPAGKLNLMMDTCFAEAFAVLMRRNRAQLLPGVEWNIFESSSEFKTSAGATELDLYLDYGNNDANSAYTGRILDKVTKAADAGQIDTNGDGQLSIDEIEKGFLDAHFATEEELKDAQAPHFDRLMGAIPVAVGDSLVAPPARSTTVGVAAGDTVPPGMQFILVDPPALHPDLFTWDPQKGELTVTGLTTISQITFRYKLVGSFFETEPVAVTVTFDPRRNFAEEFLTSGPDKVKVPCLKLDNLLYPVYQFRLTNSPGDDCKEPHWHAHGPVFPVDVLSPTGRSDPNPPSCGFGRVKEVPSDFFELSKEAWQKFLIDHIPPID